MDWERVRKRVWVRRELVGFVFTTNRGVELGCVRLFGINSPTISLLRVRACEYGLVFFRALRVEAVAVGFEFCDLIWAVDSVFDDPSGHCATGAFGVKAHDLIGLSVV